jgi:uncharacterized protein YjbJ (UPF0337 family)
MNQEQFGQFWEQLKAPLRAKWEKITDQDLLEIQGNLAAFTTILQKRYGELHKEEVSTWARRRYAHWSGNYVAYPDPKPAA